MKTIGNKMAMLVVLLLASFPTGMAQSHTENSDLNSVEWSQRVHSGFPNRNVFGTIL